MSTPDVVLLGRISEVFRAMGDPTRLAILHALHDNELTVSDLLDVVGTSQANVSRHLSVLRGASLVAVRRDGRHAHYRVAEPMVLEICELVCNSVEDNARKQLASFTEGRQIIAGDN